MKNLTTLAIPILLFLCKGLLVATNDDRQTIERSAENRFHLTGDSNRGDCSFSIIHAQAEDEGNYYFRIIGNRELRISTSTLWYDERILDLQTLFNSFGTQFFFFLQIHYQAKEKGFQAQPPAQIQWQVDGEIITEDNRENLKVTSFIQGNEVTSSFNWTVSMEVDHTILCIGSNFHGVYTVQFLLSALRDSSTTDSSPELENPEIMFWGDLQAEHPVNITCTAPGSCSLKPPHIFWKETPKEVAGRTSEMQSNGSQVYISMFDFIPSRTDNGKELTCSVIYGEGASSVSKEKTVLLNIRYPPLTPRIDVEVTHGNDSLINFTDISQTVVDKGDSVTLHCKAEGNPFPSVTWVKQSQSLGTSHLTNDSELTLANVEMQDAGTYKCQAWNSDGSAYKTLELSIRGVLSRTNEYALNVPHAVSVEKGQSVYIPCNFTYPSLVKNRMAKLYGYWYAEGSNVACDSPVATNDDNKPIARFAQKRFHLPEGLDQGVCSFIINNAQEVDQGTYFFRMEKGKAKFNYLNFQTTVTVTEAHKDILSEVFGFSSTAISFLIGLTLIKIFFCSLFFFVAFRYSSWRKTQLTASGYKQITRDSTGDQQSQRAQSFQKEKFQEEEERMGPKFLILGLLSTCPLWEGIQSMAVDYTLDAPGVVSVQEGLCVIIPCRFTYPASAKASAAELYGYWYVKGSKSYRDPSVATNDGRKEVADYARDRFHLSEGLKEGDCSLIIKEAQESDQRTYFFRMEKGGTKYTYITVQPSLRVTKSSPKRRKIQFKLDAQESNNLAIGGFFLKDEKSNIFYSSINRSAPILSAPRGCSPTSSMGDGVMQPTGLHELPTSVLMGETGMDQHIYPKGLNNACVLNQHLEYTLKSPAHVSVQQGLYVHIPCQFTYNKKHQTNSSKFYGYWFKNKDRSCQYVSTLSKDHPGLLVATNVERQIVKESTKNRIFLSGDPDEGNCSFQINDAQLQDEGSYYFRVEGGKILKYNPPKLGSTQPNPNCMREDNDLFCISAFQSQVPAQIQWQVGGETLSGNSTKGALQVISWVQTNEVISALNFSGILEGDQSIICLGSNVFGTYAVHVQLSAPIKGVHIKILVSAVCGPLITVTIFMFALYLFRLQKKKKTEEEGGKKKEALSAMRGHKAMDEDNAIYSNLMPMKASSLSHSRYTITVLDTIYVPLGFCVHVPCRFTTPNRYKRSSAPMYGYWFRIVRERYYLLWINIWAIGELMSTNDMRQNMEETHMKLTGKPAQGDCSFSIINANYKDSGWYYFLIDKGGRKYRHTFMPTTVGNCTNPRVILTDLPKPKIQTPSEIVWGMPATFSCMTTNVCSKNYPQFFWPAETSDGSMTPWKKAQSIWVQTSGIDATFIPSLADEGRRLTCRITYSAIRKTIENAIYLHMGYKPKLIHSSSHIDCLHEGQTHFCICSFNAWPPPKIQWNIYGENLTEDSRVEHLKVSSWGMGNDISSSLNWTGNLDEIRDHTVTCIATNPFGQESLKMIVLSDRKGEKHPGPILSCCVHSTNI
ncbi:hypothetical protein JD844_005727 [Phrynosoma platyrhinos]|uniref:Ig-like domain-containing protein n=1 Tax=Phrynosoma platyrhinos TaxID=52577 RepID=A0ABQ7TPB4_PHRPL|nr:hypothetical protein JD844_005727 [Phrynosoma platyrhinos]